MKVKPPSLYQIEKYFSGYNFGDSINGKPEVQRRYLANECLKVLAGFSTGSSMCSILIDLDLFVNDKRTGPYALKCITKKGKVFLYDVLSSKETDIFNNICPRCGGKIELGEAGQ